MILTRIQWGGRQVIQAVINDITERKRAEAELLRALTRERELSALKSNFVSIISHEFRTPLSIILSSAKILDSYFDRLDPTDRREQLQSIQKNSRSTARLMEDVLLLGQADAGKLKFKPLPLDLRESPVDLQVEMEDSELVFRVSDRGIGIPPQDFEWLFNSFHCDVMMPVIDGHGVLKALRDEPSTMNIPFVFLTAKGERADPRSGMNLGADDYLTKPVAREDLATILGISESTVKKHLLEIFIQLGVENTQRRHLPRPRGVEHTGTREGLKGGVVTGDPRCSRS